MYITIVCIYYLFISNRIKLWSVGLTLCWFIPGILIPSIPSGSAKLTWDSDGFWRSWAPPSSFSYGCVSRSLAGNALEMPWKCLGNALEMPWKCLGNALDMPWTCLGHALDMPWTCLGHALDMPWTCLGHALDMPWTCLGHALDMPWTCLGHALDMPWTCLGHALDMPWTCLGHALDMPWTCLGHALDMPWTCLGHALDMPWTCLGHALEMPWKCLGNALEMPWKCLGNALEMPWKCLGNALEMGVGISNIASGSPKIPISTGVSQPSSEELPSRPFPHPAWVNPVATGEIYKDGPKWIPVIITMIFDHLCRKWNSHRISESKLFTIDFIDLSHLTEMIIISQWNNII